MLVRLNKDNQYGEDGPDEGSIGSASRIIKNSDGELMLLVFFPSHKVDCWVSSDHLLYLNTTGVETYWSSEHKEL